MDILELDKAKPLSDFLACLEERNSPVSRHMPTLPPLNERFVFDAKVFADCKYPLPECVVCFHEKKLD